MTIATSRVVTIAAVLASCWSVPDVDRQLVRRWLDCVDCTGGELAGLVAKGERLVPYLASALREGPTASDDSLADRRAVEAIARATRYRQRHGVAPALSSADSSNAVRAQRDEYSLTYRLRAAQAFFRIDSLGAARAVSEYCSSAAPELQRHPEYRSSFARLGPCP
ncbi:MAG TPA: hypothetical protein VFV33_14005 [Gemmatimonadaceae bacterium]|nr:hypothetical protein [Gemmatimonadaceae bacterium]